MKDTQVQFWEEIEKQLKGLSDVTKQQKKGGEKVRKPENQNIPYHQRTIMLQYLQKQFPQHPLHPSSSWQSPS